MRRTGGTRPLSRRSSVRVALLTDGEPPPHFERTACVTILSADPDGGDGINLTVEVVGTSSVVAALPDPWRMSLGFLWWEPEVRADGSRTGGRVQVLDASTLDEAAAVPAAL